MTVQNCIDYVDAMEPNKYSEVQKARWVEECEGIVWTRAFLLQPIKFPDRPPWEMLAAELGLPAPHDKVYTRYLQAMIHYANGEYERYASSMQMFNAAWSELMQWLGQDINISDRRRNRRITVPVEPSGGVQLLIHVPEGCALIGGRLSVTKGFGKTSGLYVYCHLWRGDADNVIGGSIDLTERGDVRLPMIVADRGGETVGITTSVEDDEGVAFLTGIIAVTEEELFYRTAEIRLPVLTVLPGYPLPYLDAPEMAGTASPGTAAEYARGDHVHPHDTSKADLDTEIVTVNLGTVSSLPVTVSNAKIKASHEVIRAELGDITAQVGDWTVTTANGSLTMSGSISGSTTVLLTLGLSGKTVS